MVLNFHQVEVEMIVQTNNQLPNSVGTNVVQVNVRAGGVAVPGETVTVTSTDSNARFVGASTGLTDNRGQFVVRLQRDGIQAEVPLTATASPSSNAQASINVTFQEIIRLANRRDVRLPVDPGAKYQNFQTCSWEIRADSNNARLRGM